MKRLLLLLLCYWTTTANAQPVVGDRVPDAPLRLLTGRDTRLSAYSGKPLILDFWASWCGTCLASFPHLRALQDRFADSLTILPLTYESAGKVDTFLRSRLFLRDLPFSFVIGDTMLRKFFAPRSIPHLVWVGKEGRIRAITGYAYANEENVRRFIRGETLPFTNTTLEKKLDLTRPLFHDSVGSDSPALVPTRYAGFAPYLEGARSGSGIVRDSACGTVRFYAVNLPLVRYMAMALPEGGGWALNPRRSRLPAGSLSRYHYSGSAEGLSQWLQTNSYCYEALYPLGTSEIAMYQGLQQDLVRFFGLRFFLDTLPVPALVLTYKGKGTRRLQSRGDLKRLELGEASPYKSLHGAPLSTLVHVLNTTEGLPPVVDETGVKGNVDLDLGPIRLADLFALQKALAPYGLLLKKATRRLPYFVLQESFRSNLPSSFTTLKQQP